MLDLLSRPQPKQLRPYQSRAIAALKSSIMAGNRRIVLALATGAGKTLISANIVQGCLAKGGRVVFCAPMVTLIDQTIEAFEDEGIGHIGAIQAKHPRTDAAAPVQVASVQTLVKRDQMPEATIVLVDECHVYSKAAVEWMKARPDLIFVGLSATPGRAGMADEWDDLVVGATTRELIDAGFLSKFTVYAPNKPDMTGIRTGANGDYETAGAEGVMSDAKLVGDITQNYLLHGEGRPTLGFAVSVAHAKRMAQEFNDAGIPSAYVEGMTDILERKALQRQFRRGELRVIWSVRTMTTGVDLPVSGIIDAAPTKSEMLHQQKIGRGLRVNDDTPDLKIWDHAGNTLRLGFVTDLDWSRLPKGKREEKARKADKSAPLPKECANCATLMEPKEKVCPCCGEERKPPSGYVETEDGDLVPIGGPEAEPKAAKVSMAVKQDWYSSLLGIAQERGHKPGWAYHKFNEKFGIYPANTLRKWACEPLPEVRSWVKSRAIAFAKAKEARNAA